MNLQFMVEERKMSNQSLVGIILVFIGIIVTLIGFFVISPINDFVTVVLVSSLGFLLIFVGGGILKTRIGQWVKQ